MAARYGPHQFMNSAAAAAAAGYTQFSAGMPGSMQGMYGGTGGNMAGMAATSAHGQQSTQRLPMAADYGLSLVSNVYWPNHIMGSGTPVSQLLILPISQQCIGPLRLLGPSGIQTTENAQILF